MADERIDAGDRVTSIRRSLKMARTLVRFAGAKAKGEDETTYQRCRLALDCLDDAADSNNQVDTHLHLIDVAYDEDVARGARNERHLRAVDESSEREEARKVGRETL